MSVATLGSVRRVARRVRNRLVGGVVVLLYHRVASPKRDPQLLAVSPDHFEEHLNVLRHLGRVVSLEQAERDLRAGRCPRRTFVVTFDDGYVDNLTHAKPILEKNDAAATVFVPSGHVGGRPFYWQTLEWLLLDAATLPGELSLTIGAQRHAWSFNQEGYGGAVRDDGADEAWNVLDRANPTPRHGLYRELCDLLRPMAGGEREAVLGALAAQLGDKGSEARRASAKRGGDADAGRVVDVDELNALASGDLVEIGAHTVSHSMLSRLPVDEQRVEVRRSRAELEAWTGRAVRSFAYPFGSRIDYTGETIDVVRDCGFDRACANVPGVARLGVDPFALPRFLVRDWDGDGFARRVRQWVSE